MVPGVDVLIKAGLQVPLMLLLDVTGNAGATEFRQSEPNGSKGWCHVWCYRNINGGWCGTLTRFRGKRICGRAESRCINRSRTPGSANAVIGR